MKAAGSRKAGFVARIQDAPGCGETLFGILYRQTLKKPFGADSDPSFEEPLKVKLAEAVPGRDFL